jgi:hypothetical protein
MGREPERAACAKNSMVAVFSELVRATQMAKDGGCDQQEQPQSPMLSATLNDGMRSEHFFGMLRIIQFFLCSNLLFIRG